jgi:hypothetical protein
VKEQERKNNNAKKKKKGGLKCYYRHDIKKENIRENRTRVAYTIGEQPTN